MTQKSRNIVVSLCVVSAKPLNQAAISCSVEPAAPVTVTGITAAGKTYDGTAAATLTGGTLSGVAEGDTVALDFSDAKAEFDSKDAGNDKGVTVKGALKLTGADAHKYALTQPELNDLKADITPCAAFDDATSKDQIIYVGEDRFAAPRFTGIGGEEVTGTLRYTLSDGKTEADIPEMLRALKARDSLNIPYTFTASGNYSGEKTGAVTVMAQERPSSGGGSHTSSYPVTMPVQTQNGSVADCIFSSKFRALDVERNALSGRKSVCFVNLIVVQLQQIAAGNVSQCRKAFCIEEADAVFILCCVCCDRRAILLKNVPIGFLHICNTNRGSAYLILFAEKIDPAVFSVVIQVNPVTTWRMIALLAGAAHTGKRIKQFSVVLNCLYSKGISTCFNSQITAIVFIVCDRFGKMIFYVERIRLPLVLYAFSTGLRRQGHSNRCRSASNGSR